MSNIIIHLFQCGLLSCLSVLTYKNSLPLLHEIVKIVPGGEAKLLLGPSKELTVLSFLTEISL